MTNHKFMLDEIENLYRVVDEVFDEYERLKEKLTDNKASSEDLMLEHLINKYYG